MNVKLATDRLILRPITETDAKDFFELDSNPEVHKYLGNNPVKSITESKALIANIIEHYKINGIGRLAIIDKQTRAFVGWAGLKYEEHLREEFNYYDLGYRLKQKFWGQGYATEAALASLDYGFKELELNEICAAVSINNKASNKILKKIGMVQSGTFTYKGEVCNWYIIKNKSL